MSRNPMIDAFVLLLMAISFVAGLIAGAGYASDFAWAQAINNRVAKYDEQTGEIVWITDVEKVIEEKEDK